MYSVFIAAFTCFRISELKISKNVIPSVCIYIPGIKSSTWRKTKHETIVKTERRRKYDSNDFRDRAVTSGESTSLFSENICLCLFFVSINTSWSLPRPLSLSSSFLSPLSFYRYSSRILYIYCYGTKDDKTAFCAQKSQRKREFLFWRDLIYYKLFHVN
jgi:hypothetical protein